MSSKNLGLQQAAATKKKDFQIKMGVTTDWPDDKAAEMLASIAITTHDGEKVIRVKASPGNPR